MATNFYFQNYKATMEQSLIEDLIIETIRIHGQDVYYMPRTLTTNDDLLNESDQSIFNNAFLLEVYPTNVEGFEGEGDFLSKFGVEVRDSITFTLARRTFAQHISVVDERARPYEGDLIFFPLVGKAFEVSHVEHEKIFYQANALQTYDLKCHLFEYSNELFQTGVEEIDNMWKHLNTSSEDETEIDNIERFSDFADNETIETEGAGVLDFTEGNPFGDDEY